MSLTRDRVNQRIKQLQCISAEEQTYLVIYFFLIFAFMPVFTVNPATTTRVFD